MIDEVLDDNLAIETSVYNSRPNHAPFFIRFGAAFLDLLILAPIIIINIYNALFIKNISIAVFLIILYHAYRPYMEYNFGATFGKMALQIKVVNYKFQKINLKETLFRNAPWIVSGILSVLWILDLYSNENFELTDNLTAYWNILKLRANDILQTFLLAFWLASAILMVFGEKNQGVHDLLAKTYCIKLSKNA